MKSFLTKAGAILATLGTFAFHLLKQIYSVIADKHWDVDGWKVGGWAAFAFAGFLAFQSVDILRATHDAIQAGVPGGLATAFITVGTFLFGQSVQSDRNLPNLPTSTDIGKTGQ